MLLDQSTAVETGIWSIAIATASTVLLKIIELFNTKNSREEDRKDREVAAQERRNDLLAQQMAAQQHADNIQRQLADNTVLTAETKAKTDVLINAVLPK